MQKFGGGGIRLGLVIILFFFFFFFFFMCSIKLMNNWFNFIQMCEHNRSYPKTILARKTKIMPVYQKK